jgi:hypothetical protein
MMQYAALTDTIKAGYPVLVTLGIWFLFYVVRKKFPGVWRVCFRWVPADAGPMARRTLQGLPSAVVGALVLSVGSGLKPGQVALGAIAGACAPLWHHLVKAAPNRYQGALGDETGQGVDIPVGSGSDSSRQSPNGSDE